MLNNELFGPIKQWGFLVKNLDQARQSWVELMEIDQMMVDAFDMYAEQIPDWDGSEPYQLVSL